MRQSKSDATLTHPKCLRFNVCQEVKLIAKERGKGGASEGICDDGCVWYQPKRKK